MTDHIYEGVHTAIASIRNGDSITAFEAIKSLETTDVLAELVLTFEELVEGRDTDQLIQLAILSLPKNPEGLIQTINQQNFPQLLAFFQGKLVDMFAGLLFLIASFQEVTELLGRDV